MSKPARNLAAMKTPTARYFQRREDYQPPATHADSPFQQFVVRCLKCNSFKLSVISEFEEESGEAKAFLFCPPAYRLDRQAMNSEAKEPVAGERCRLLKGRPETHKAQPTMTLARPVMTNNSSHTRLP
jgi:hypothetical protein